MYVCICIYRDRQRQRWAKWRERGSERQREIFKIGLCDSAGFCCCSVAKLFLTLWIHGLQHTRLPYASLSPGACSNSCPSCPLFLTLWIHGLQHIRLPYASLYPGACSNSCPLSWWCHSTILTSIIPFISCTQSFPAWGSYPMRQLFALWPKHWSFSFSICPSINIQGWFPLELTSLISLLFKGLSRVFSNTIVWIDSSAQNLIWLLYYMQTFFCWFKNYNCIT